LFYLFLLVDFLSFSLSVFVFAKQARRVFFVVEAFLTFSYFGGARIHARTAAPFVEMRAKKK
jgi:hypothetical protein